MSQTGFSTVAAIRADSLSKGHHWFSRDTMRFFKSRVLRGVWPSFDGLYYFVSSEQRGFRPEDGRGYSVRAYNPATGGVTTVGEFNGYSTPRAARKAAREIAAAAPAP